MTRFKFMALLSFSVCFSIGCTQTESPTPKTVATEAAPSVPAADGAKYLLKAAPVSAKDVILARKDVKDGDDVVIEGRIGGEENPWVEGRASFLIVDRSLVPCNEREGDGCKTPWDYCCDTDKLPKSKATVKFVDDQGKTLTTDARKLLGVKELQTVVVQGKAKRDDAGNLTVLASGLFVKPVGDKAKSKEASK